MLSDEVREILDEARKVCAWANKQEVENITEEKIRENKDFTFWDDIEIFYESCERAYIPSKPEISLDYKSYTVDITTYYINFTHVRDWDIHLFGGDFDNCMIRKDGAYFVSTIESKNENNKDILEWRPPYELHMDEYMFCTRQV